MTANTVQRGALHGFAGDGDGDVGDGDVDGDGAVGDGDVDGDGDGDGDGAVGDGDVDGDGDGDGDVDGVGETGDPRCNTTATGSDTARAAAAESAATVAEASSAAVSATVESTINRALRFDAQLVVDNQLHAHRLGAQGHAHRHFGAGRQVAVIMRPAQRGLDFALRVNPDLLQKFSDLHVQRLLVHNALR